MTTPNPLAQWIEDHAASRAQFCRDRNIDESHLSLFFKGKRGFSFGKAQQISSATGVPVEALVRATKRRRQPDEGTA